MKFTLQCHSGTSKEQIEQFIIVNKGKVMSVNYEHNIYQHWGDDDIGEFNTSVEKEYNDLIRLIRNHYIHSINCK